MLSERVENKSSSLGSSFIRGAITLGVTYGPWPFQQVSDSNLPHLLGSEYPCMGLGVGGRVGRWEIIFFYFLATEDMDAT